MLLPVLLLVLFINTESKQTYSNGKLKIIQKLPSLWNENKRVESDDAAGHFQNSISKAASFFLPVGGIFIGGNSFLLSGIIRSLSHNFLCNA